MSDAPSKPKKVLLLGPPSNDKADVLRQFGPQADVRVVEAFAQALDAMRHDQFDLIISAPSEFLGLERAAATQPATIILETMTQGVCIVDASGRLLYANPAMRHLPEEVLSQVCQECRVTPGRWGESGPGASPGPRRFGVTAAKDQHFEVTASPALAPDGAVSQVVAVVWDVTDARRLRQKIDAIERAGRDLVQFGSAAKAAMTIEDRIRLLEEKILRCLHDLMHFDNFAVLLWDRKTNRLDFVLQHGMSERSRSLEIYATEKGNGISGYVAVTGRSYVCQDAGSDSRFIEGLPKACSSVTVPLRLHDTVIGVFDIESERAAAFNEEDRQFAEILGSYIALALNTLELMVTERYVTTGRLADDVSTEIAGPLNDILTDASTLMEEYIGHDDMRRRLSAICDNVATIKKSIREVASPKGGLLGRRSAPSQKDPLLDGKRVLVADDEEIIRETIAGVLVKFGCAVETAPDGEAAVRMIEAGHYDIVLADIKMPHKNGYEIFAAVRRRSGSTPVLLMTAFGYDPNHSIVRAQREGLAGVLFKPFKIDDLLDNLRRSLTPVSNTESN